MRPASASTSRRTAATTWTKLADSCVSNAKYACATPGKDAFLGRGINSIVVDPTNPNHIFVGSAQAVRGLSHVIGAGGTARLEPGANKPGLYESTDGGATFTEVWDGATDPAARSASRTSGSTRSNPATVYASAFDAGPLAARRRSTARGAVRLHARCSSRSSRGRRHRPPDVRPDRKNGHTRHLPDRTAPRTAAANADAAGRRTSGARTSATSPRRRCSRRRPRRCTPPAGHAHVPGDVQRLADA